MRLISVLVVIVFLASCARQPYVVTDYNASYDFASLRSFDLAGLERDKENILISPFTYQHLDQVLSEQLSSRYLRVDADATPDFLVSYHIVVEDKLDARHYNASYSLAYRRHYYWPYHGPHVLHGGPQTYTQGSLIIDMVDARTGEPIWRGVSEKRLRERQTPQAQREALTAAMAEVLAKFPPVGAAR